MRAGLRESAPKAPARLGAIAMPGLLTALAVLALGFFTVRAAGCSKSESGLPIIKLAVGDATVRAFGSVFGTRSSGTPYERKRSRS